MSKIKDLFGQHSYYINRISVLDEFLFTKAVKQLIRNYRENEAFRREIDRELGFKIETRKPKVK